MAVGNTAHPTLAGEYETAQGDSAAGGKRGAKVVIGQDGNWVVVNEDGEVIAASDTEHPERGKPREKKEEPTEKKEE